MSISGRERHKETVDRGEGGPEVSSQELAPPLPTPAKKGCGTFLSQKTKFSPDPVPQA